MSTTETHEAAHPATMYCSFCGKAHRQVAKLIAGPGVYICDECVGLCDRILADQPIPSFPSWDEQSDDDLLSRVTTIAASRDQVEGMLEQVVHKLRHRGVTWAQIGEALGITRQSAWERFSGEE